MQAEALGNGPIDQIGEEVGTDGLADVGAKFIPGLALRANVKGQAFGAIAAIGFLRDLEDQFGHGFIFALSEYGGAVDKVFDGSRGKLVYNGYGR